MAVVGRIFIVIGAYLLACIAAALVLTIGALAPNSHETLSLAIRSDALWPVVGLGAVIIAALGMLPATVVVVLAEAFGLRSALAYGALGGVLALFLQYGVGYSGLTADVDGGDFPNGREVLAAAGIMGGFVYWLAAGRRAGAWRVRS